MDDSITRGQPTSPSPSPPVLIRLVSPPTPESNSPASVRTGHDSDFRDPESDPTRHTRGARARPNGSGRATTLSSSSHSTDPILASDTRTRSSTTFPFNFSTLFPSSTALNIVSPRAPHDKHSHSRSHPHKVRSPSLGTSIRKTNVGRVKAAALGLARRVSQTVRLPHQDLAVKTRHGITSKRSATLRKIDEREFPNVGALNEARTLRRCQEARQKDRTVADEWPNSTAPCSRASPAIKSRRRSSPLGALARSTPVARASPHVKTRKDKYQARVSFPRLSLDSGTNVMNRPRPVPRRTQFERCIRPETDVEEDEEDEDDWLDEAFQLDSDPRHRPSSPLSATSYFQHLPFLRSYHAPPVAPAALSFESNAFRNSRLVSSWSPPSSRLDSSDESFQCRGDRPFTPFSEQNRSPVQARNREGARRGEGAWPRTSPRNAVYISRSSSDIHVEPWNILSRQSDLLQFEREDHQNRRGTIIELGDLTRFLEELVFEQVESTSTPTERDQDVDVFSDATERAEIVYEDPEYDFAISTATIDRSTSKATFQLSLPPARRRPRPTNRVVVEYCRDGSPSRAFASTCLTEQPISSGSLDCQSDNGDDGDDRGDLQVNATTTILDDDPIEVLSASRETLVRGGIVARKGSLSSLGFVRPGGTCGDKKSSISSPATSLFSNDSARSTRGLNPQNDPTSPLSSSSSSIFTRLQARRPRYIYSSRSFSSSPKESEPYSTTARSRSLTAESPRSPAQHHHDDEDEPEFDVSPSPSPRAAVTYVTAPSTPHVPSDVPILADLSLHPWGIPSSSWPSRTRVAAVQTPFPRSCLSSPSTNDEEEDVEVDRRTEEDDDDDEDEEEEEGEEEEQVDGPPLPLPVARRRGQSEMWYDDGYRVSGLKHRVPLKMIPQAARTTTTTSHGRASEEEEDVVVVLDRETTKKTKNVKLGDETTSSTKLKRKRRETMVGRRLGPIEVYRDSSIEPEQQEEEEEEERQRDAHFV